MSFTNGGYITVTDYVTADGSVDISDKLQKIVNDNPKRTIFFPDGTYLVSKPICTSAIPSNSVSLVLSNYAVIKASENWTDDGAIIRIGGKEPANDNFSVGSNYGIEGGIIDGSGRADGISIDSGRESFIRNISIKNTKIAINIKFGANSGSSDADIIGVNIVGTAEKDSVGIAVDGFDNTLTNIRIANVQTGVKLTGSGNMLRNVHPLYIFNHGYEGYTDSVGFWDERGNNWFDYCYSDQFATGFYTADSAKSILNNCYCFWYSPMEKSHIAFKAETSFDSIVTNLKIGFHDKTTENIVLHENSGSGTGVFDHLCVDEEMVTDDTYRKYLLKNSKEGIC